MQNEGNNLLIYSYIRSSMTRNRTKIIYEDKYFYRETAFDCVENVLITKVLTIFQ